MKHRGVLYVRVKKNWPKWALVAVLVVGAGCAVHANRPHETRSPAAAVSASRPATPAQSGPSSPSGKATDPDAALAAALAGIGRQGHLSLAVTDLDTGTSAAYAPDSGHSFVTASIAKVDILATELLQAQQAGRGLTADERADNQKMIESSDNDAADRCWTRIGGAEGVAAANHTFGLTHTVPGGVGHWGLTTTTAADQLRLMRAVATGHSPLSADSRSYILDLMTHIEAGQDWGVSAAADATTATALKNGWLPRSDSGLWVVNSIGSVRHGGHRLLIAALSDGNSSEQTGISVIESAIRPAADLIVKQESS